LRKTGVAQAVTAEQVSVRLHGTTDADGVVRTAEVAPADQEWIAANSALQAFAKGAVRAVLDYRCSALPLPPSLLGKPQSFTFRVSP
jgi:hypothetical protein